MEKENSADDKQNHPDEKIFWFVAIGFIAMVVAPTAYIIAFFDYEAGGPGEWGSFATYFSGIVTPIVALCSAVLFFRSIIVQRREFEATRNEMKAAYELQLNAENTRASINKQEQLERTIPKVRQIQAELFERLGRVPDSLSWGLGTYTKSGFNTDPQKLFEVAKKADLMHRFGALLILYARKGEHTIKMLLEYLDVGGDIYFHLDVIDELEQEHDTLFRFIRIFSFTEDKNYLRYKALLEELYTVKEKSMADY